jgi:hypothetical protein
LKGGGDEGAEAFVGVRFRVAISSLLKSGGDEELGVGRASVFG